MENWLHYAEKGLVSLNSQFGTQALSNGIMKRVLKLRSKWMITFQQKCLRQSSAAVSPTSTETNQLDIHTKDGKGSNAVFNFVTCKSSWHNWQAGWKYYCHRDPKWSGNCRTLHDR